MALHVDVTDNFTGSWYVAQGFYTEVNFFMPGSGSWDRYLHTIQLRCGSGKTQYYNTATNVGVATPGGSVYSGWGYQTWLTAEIWRLDSTGWTDTGWRGSTSTDSDPGLPASTAWLEVHSGPYGGYFYKHDDPSGRGSNLRNIRFARYAGSQNFISNHTYQIRLYTTGDRSNRIVVFSRSSPRAEVISYSSNSVNTLTYPTDGSGGTISGDGPYFPDQVVTITATANPGWQFTFFESWNPITGFQNYYTNPHTFTMTDAEWWFTARFERVITTGTLTYNANGAKQLDGLTPVIVPAPHTFTNGVTFNVSTYLPVDGELSREFRGWNTNSSAEWGVWGPGTSVTLYENTTLYAIWGPVPDPPEPALLLKYYNSGTQLWFPLLGYKQFKESDNTWNVVTILKRFNAQSGEWV